MVLYEWASDKALRKSQLMFQLGYANKIGEKYYISREAQNRLSRLW